MRRTVKGHKECESKNFYNFNGDFIVEKVIRFQKNGFFEKSSSEDSQESYFLAESLGFADDFADGFALFFGLVSRKKSRSSFFGSATCLLADRKR